MRNLALAFLCCAVLLNAGPAVPDSNLLQSVLQKYVLADGTVRYGDLKKDMSPLEQYVKQVAEVSPDSNPELFPSRDAKLAYWIDAYNALVLASFTQDYPEKR